jgi:hypothetical protein
MRRPEVTNGERGSFGTRILVDGDVRAQRGFRILAGDALADHVDQHQVVLGAAGDDLVAARDDRVRHRLRVLHHLLLVVLELRLQRFLEGDGLGGDDVHQRTALDAGNTSDWNFFSSSSLALADDDAAARTAQGLVRGRGDHVRMRHRVRIHAGGDQTGDVRHVDEQIRADLVGDGAEARPVDDLRIGEKPPTIIFGLLLQRQRSTSS